MDRDALCCACQAVVGTKAATVSMQCVVNKLEADPQQDTAPTDLDHELLGDESRYKVCDRCFDEHTAAADLQV
jgi:hypothetical protein